MKIHPIFYFLLLPVLLSCEDEASKKALSQNLSTQQLTIDQQRFDQAWSQLQTDHSNSDPFQLNGLRNDSTMLMIDVAYSGGCEEHDFELIWPEVITMIYPPRYTVILNHESNNDACEAYLSSTLYFDLSQYDLGLTPEIMDVIDLTVINGSDGDDMLKLNN
ncbi:hypothetical protein [Reichenbachiella sp.]|uniref:hypothetical protein n=1 Tax=Reichenbachiella sp. TaxID=2184521 RepID=UPI003BB0186F